MRGEQLNNGTLTNKGCWTRSFQVGKLEKLQLRNGDGWCNPRGSNIYV